MVIVWLLYLAVFGLVLAIIWPPPISRLEPIVAVVGGSFLIAWLGTVRAMQMSPDSSPPYLLASVTHGILLVAAIVALAAA